MMNPPSPSLPPQRPRARRGTGHLYQRGAVWWVQYVVNGRRVWESTGTTRKREAAEFLQTRLGRAAEGRPIPPRVDRILYGELAADLGLHYQTTGRRDAKDVAKHLRPLDAFFRGRRAVDLDEAAITRYVAARQATPSRRGGPLANGTINRELSLLGTMLRLAGLRRKVLHVLPIPLLKEAAPRAGFFEADQFAAVRGRLRPDLQLAVDLAYTYGWRVRDEVLTLERRHVDLDGALSGWTRGRRRTTTAASCISPLPWRPQSRRNWTGSGRWSARSAASSRGCSRTRRTARSTRRPGSAATWRATASGTSVGPGGPPAGAPAAPGCSGTTSAGRRCGTS
jgi:hypothetical protein